MTAPKIDARTRRQIIERTRSLAAHYSGWQPGKFSDPGSALIDIFSFMADHVTQKLNQTPEKNFLAFLNLIGVEPLPPIPARVPLTFTLAEGTKRAVKVPAETPAAALDPEGGEDIVFQTERALYLSTAKIAGIFVRDPLNDLYSEYSATPLDPDAGEVDAFQVFRGKMPIEHSLYIARDDLFALPVTKTITLTVESPDAGMLNVLPISWSYWDGDEWAALAARIYQVSSYQWEIVFENCPIPAPGIINGVEARWIKAQLNVALPQTLSYNSLALLDATVLELTGPFEPYGERLHNTPFVMRFDSASENVRQIVCQVVINDPGKPSPDLVLLWEYWDGTQWKELGKSGPAAFVDYPQFSFVDGSEAFTHDGKISFQVPPGWSTSSGVNQDSWLRVTVERGTYGEGNDAQWPVLHSLIGIYKWQLTTLPKIERITIDVYTTSSNLLPDTGYNNGNVLDMSADFYPFGLEPGFNSTFYLGNEDVFSKPNARVFLDIVLTNPVGIPRNEPPLTVNASPNIVLAWEVWDGKSWLALGYSGKEHTSLQESVYNFEDNTFALTRSGRISFVLPWLRDSKALANGQHGYWLRVRLAQGNYGLASSMQSNGRQYTFVSATYQSPAIQSIKIHYAFTPRGPLDHCFGYNNFTYVDLTVLSAQEESLFEPYSRATDIAPTIYFAFRSGVESRQPFADNSPVTLYFQTDDELRQDEMDALAKAAPTVPPPRIVWEYSSPSGWSAIRSADETHSFTERGIVEFIGPADFTEVQDFGETHYWLRAKWVQGLYTVEPRLRRVLINTTWASNHILMDKEMLGSGNGEALQTFTTSTVPVLPEQILEVEYDDGWFVWQEVTDFFTSGPRDFHYTIDRLRGLITFGDGRHGRIPPQGTNNIRITYKTGGGEKGNLPATHINQLKTTIPNVDSVINYNAAMGGSPLESMDRIKQRGPRTLRHNNRAVTMSDYADLASEIAAVKRVVVLAPTPLNGMTRGEVGVVIVPDSLSAKPVPSLGLLEDVKKYLLERCPPTTDVWISGPDWVCVSVRAEIVPTNFEVGPTVQKQALDTLDRFLHPLYGGLNGEGWEFGRQPHESDFYALIEAIDGVDYIRGLEIEQADMDKARSGRFLVYSGNHEILLV